MSSPETTQEQPRQPDLLQVVRHLCHPGVLHLEELLFQQGLQLLRLGPLHLPLELLHRPGPRDKSLLIVGLELLAVHRRSITVRGPGRPRLLERFHDRVHVPGDRLQQLAVLGPKPLQQARLPAVELLHRPFELFPFLLPVSQLRFVVLRDLGIPLLGDQRVEPLGGFSGRVVEKGGEPLPQEGVLRLCSPRVVVHPHAVLADVLQVIDRGAGDLVERPTLQAVVLLPVVPGGGQGAVGRPQLKARRVGPAQQVLGALLVVAEVHALAEPHPHAAAGLLVDDGEASVREVRHDQSVAAHLPSAAAWTGQHPKR
ncbi:hypothetical protein [Streptomyces sp. 1222.5]|uniref:hypothetical protein n=1 Tax=Streptomyces sp. 1222.5 TaxID=1881026 RepID=UPI003EB9216C